MHASLAVRVAAGVLLFASGVFAQPRGVDTAPLGRVLRVDQDLLVIDSVGDDLAPGQQVRLMRPLSVRHPINGALLRDRYALGVVTLYSVGAQLSVARVTEGLLRPAQVGDEVEPLSERPRPPPRPASEPPRVAPPPTTASRPPPPPPTVAAPMGTSAPSPPPPPSDDDAVLAAWRDTLGAPPEQRLGRWSQYLQAHPRSRHDAAVRAAVAQLRGDIARESALARAATAPAAAASGGPVGRGAGIPNLMLGDTARFAMQVTSTAVRPRGTLFVRRRGAEAYVSVPLATQGDRYVMAEVPARFVALEGFEYFVSLEGENNDEVHVLGTARAPTRVSVSRRAEDEPTRRGRTRIDLRGEFADVGSRTVSTPTGPVFRAQRFYLVEGDFFQRVSLPGLYGYRVGFGVYEGEGVALSQVESASPSTSSTVIYGYHELEFEILRALHVMARGALGVHGEGIVGGAQLRVRIGEELRTNLVLGGDLFNEIGQRAFFALNLSVHPRVPLLAQGEVFNQSFSGGDPMFRFILQAGVRVTPWLTLSARGSYQLRNIQNGGFGGGLNTTFDW